MPKFTYNDTARMTRKQREVYERRKLVLNVIRMRLNEKEALKYLKDEGYTIDDTTLYRDKQYLEKNKLKRIYDVAKTDFEDRHMERIDNMELILKLMWRSFLKEKNIYKGVCILEKIAALQPYLAAFYETTKDIIQSSPLIQEKLKMMENILNEKEKDDDDDLKGKKGNQIISVLEKNAIQSIIEQSGPKEENSSVSESGREEEDRGEDREGDTEKEDGETHTDIGEATYRREKQKGIF